MYVHSGMAIARAARAGKTPDEVAAVLLDRSVEPMALYGVLVLVGGFLAVIGLIVFGVASAWADSHGAAGIIPLAARGDVIRLLFTLVQGAVSLAAGLSIARQYRPTAGQ